MKLNPKQVAAVLALTGAERYRHFIKRIADMEEAWGLYDDGWAMAGTDAGDAVFPLWPAAEYAEKCAEGPWAQYKPRSISFDELLDVYLPNFESEGTLSGIFYTSVDKGVTPTVAQLARDLSDELDNYK